MCLTMILLLVLIVLQADHLYTHARFLFIVPLRCNLCYFYFDAPGMAYIRWISHSDCIMQKKAAAVESNDGRLHSKWSVWHLAGTALEVQRT